MPIIRTARADEPTVPPISRANDPVTSGNGEVTASPRAIPARLQQNPDAG
jgi:hypothetical protein